MVAGSADVVDVRIGITVGDEVVLGTMEVILCICVVDDDVVLAMDDVRIVVCDTGGRAVVAGVCVGVVGDVVWTDD